MPSISSRTNPRIKAIRSLRSKKARDASGLFLVEGIRHVGEAVEAGADIEAIYYAPELLSSSFGKELIQQQSILGLECIQLSAGVFDSVADKENPQGILAVVRKGSLSLPELSPAKFPWGVAIVTPQDPGNLGAILRTVEAVGASGIILLDGGVDPYHPNAVRASMGTLFQLKLTSASFDEFSGWACQHGYHVYGSSARGEVDFRLMHSYGSPRILLLGSERDGLTAEQAGICECLVRLPMLGKATSLNLAVAAGVLLYSMLDK